MTLKRWLSLMVLAGLAALYFFTPVRRYFTLAAVIGFVARIKTNPRAPILFILFYAASCAIWPLTVFPVAAGVLFR